MNHTAIRITNLGKKYILDHQADRGRNTLRDTIVGAFSRNKGQTVVGSTATKEEFWALKDLTLEVKTGEVLGVVGHNGAGKSTFLKLLSRITQPTEGSIEYRGRVASLLEVGAGFHAELSGRENIFLNGAILGMRHSEIQKKFDEIVAFAGVERFLDTPVKRYSSGMYMRLAFAVAANLEPDILLVDEVLAVGDAAFQRKCLGKMQAVAAEGSRTVVFVSHNMQAVKSLCSQVAHLSQGLLVDSGPAEDVVRRYLAATSTQASRWSPDPNRAPRSEGLALLAVEVSDGVGAASVFSSCRDLHIDMTFSLAAPLASLCVGFDLFTSDGAAVFRTYQTDSAESTWPEQITGTQTWRCTIPAGLLNGGTYSISPKISIHNVKWLVQFDSVLQFEVVLDHGVSPFWNSLNGISRPGFVCPIFSWKQLSDSRQLPYNVAFAPTIPLCDSQL